MAAHVLAFERPVVELVARVRELRDLASTDARWGPELERLEEKAAHLARLRRIEGQVRGLQRMVESDTYCIDVLTQVSAATRALESFALGLLHEHLSHCVSNAIAAGQNGDEARAQAEAKIREASDAIARLVRS